MECKAVVTSEANKWSITKVDVEDIQGVIVKVCYSSLCGTDRDVVSGNLIYYRNGVAKFPIITGHEWCGLYKDQPVTGVCILGCGGCKKCVQGNPIHCDSRREVGVVNKNGAHAEYIVIPEDSLVAIPEILPKYALIEPLAVCVHAINKLKIDQSMRILISGYGCIGKLCGLVLNLRGYSHEVYDPRYTGDLEFRDFDIIMECSGHENSLTNYLDIKGSRILIFGFEYKDVNPSLLTANEMSIFGTLGSTIEDFKQASEIMKYIEPDFFEIIPWTDFGGGMKRSALGKKTVFNHIGD